MNRAAIIIAHLQSSFQGKVERIYMKHYSFQQYQPDTTICINSISSIFYSAHRLTAPFCRCPRRHTPFNASHSSTSTQQQEEDNACAGSDTHHQAGTGQCQGLLSKIRTLCDAVDLTHS